MKLSSKVAYSIIIPGLFTITAFFALGYQNASSGFYVVVGFLVAFLLLFGFYAGRSFSVSIKKIVTKADELANGTLGKKVQTIDVVELDDLAKSLDGIGKKLQEHEQEKEKGYYVVAAKVHTATKPLHESIDVLEEKVKNRTFEMDRAKSISEKLQVALFVKEAQVTVMKNSLDKIVQQKNTDNISKEV